MSTQFMRTRLWQAMLGLSLLSSVPLYAASFVYEGQLDDRGVPANGRYDIQLAVYRDIELGATLRTPIVFNAVDVVAGRFRLDFEVPLEAAEPAWVELAVRDAGGSSFSAIPGRTKATQAPAAIGACWSSVGDSGSNPATNFLGTTDAQPLVLRTRNVQSLRIEPSAELFAGNSITANVIAGSSVNSVTSGVRGAAISGGGAPENGDPDFIFASPNRVTDHYGSVGGGLGNQAGNATGTVGDNAFATVGGGRLNSASAGTSSVGGGVENVASGSSSTVGGGTGNRASASESTVGGGYFNFASGQQSGVGGGYENTASYIGSSVVGGFENTASGAYAAVGGGLQNCAGGQSSLAVGTRAKVRPGGSSGAVGSGCLGVPVTGDGGGDAGTFVWADNQASTFTSTGDNQFLVRSAGGVAINTNTPAAGSALTVNGDTSTSGNVLFGSSTRQMLNLWGPTSYGIGIQSSTLYARVASNSGFAWFEGGVHSNVQNDPGAGGIVRMTLSNVGQLRTTTGTITTLSDARVKTDIRDYTGALDQISALHPVHYRYRDAGKAAFQPAGEHLGFIAQEVQTVFPQWVTHDDEGYLNLSLRGFEAVAVRAIQELDAKYAVELATVQAENAALRARLDALEARLSAGAK